MSAVTFDSDLEVFLFKHCNRSITAAEALYCHTMTAAVILVKEL